MPSQTMSNAGCGIKLVMLLCALAVEVPTAGLAQTPPVPVVTAVNLSGQSLQQVPMTFGEPFRAGDIPRDDTIVAYLNGMLLPTQANIKARNPDGSVRHAILTVLLPTLSGGGSETLALRPAPQAGTVDTKPLTLGDLLQTNFNAAVSIDISGQAWHLDARTLLHQALGDRACRPFGRKCSVWLSGPLVSEWIVGGPLLNAQGQPHPHLAAYFAVRAYGPGPVKRARVDVIVENDWAYAPDPHNITYNATINVGGQTVYTINELTHYRQSRWHQVFWWGAPDPVYARLDSAYLQYSLAVPHYENLPAPAWLLNKVIQNCAPMDHCGQTSRMGNTGAQPAIGPLPRWTSVYVIDPRYQAFRWMLANSDALGSYGVHYRDQVTGQPLSIADHPCATVVKPAEVAKCSVAPYADDRFPACTAQCKSPLSPDEGHHPAPAYVAYMVTGDWYYLDELTDWAVWVSLWQNPEYRNYTDGLLSHDEQRGQAWGLRTLGYAAYILPDQDPFKSRFEHVVESNIRWYNNKYTDNPNANKLGVIINGYTVAYPNHGQTWTGIPTWQNSFFVWSVGNLKDLGFPGAAKLLDWVAKFPIDLMTSPDFCWTEASAYQLQIRETRTSPIYNSLKEVYANTFPKLRGVECNSDAMVEILNRKRGNKYVKGAMMGYPSSPTGFPANFQVGLAQAATANLQNASEAWSIFESRAVKPNYSTSPQFAVIPRSL